MRHQTFNSDLAFARYNGTQVAVLRRINDIRDNDGYAHPAFEVRFHDGFKAYAYASELRDGKPGAAALLDNHLAAIAG